MEICCVKINTKYNSLTTQDIISINCIEKNLFNLGLNYNKLITTKNITSSLANIFGETNEDLIILLGSDDSKENQQIKSNFCNCFNLSLSDFYLELDLKGLPKEEYFFPSNSEFLLNNCKSLLQAFLLETNNKFYLFLPNDIDVINYTFKYYINPMIIRKSKKIYNNFIYKTLGIPKYKIESELKEILDSKNFIYKITEENLDANIIIRYQDNLDSEIIDKTTSIIYEKFNKYIYSLEDSSIFKVACDLLNLSNSSISIAENLTMGNIIKKLSEYDTQSKINSGIIFTNIQSISNNFKISQNILDENAFSNVELIYEIATDMLERNNSDLVLCSMGQIEKDTENTYKAVNFIAVGDIDGIHVYKNIFTGGYNSIIESITKTAIFYLIKKIKRNDLLFSQSTI